MRLLTAACIAAIIGVTATPAFADEYETRQQRVYYGDLDPYDRRDANTLLGRIDRAADNVCDDRMPQPPSAHQDEAICEAIAREDAVRDVANPVVTAMHRGYAPAIDVDDGYYPDKK